MISRPACPISDTSPLSAMAIMGWLPWLKERWGTVLVPQEVWRELERIGDDDAFDSLRAARESGLIEVTVAPPFFRPDCSHLHAGELAAISLSLERKAQWLIVDDGDARKAAKALGLRIIGLLGMMVWAKKQGHLERVGPAIDEVRQRTGFRLSAEVVEQVLSDLGEIP